MLLTALLLCGASAFAQGEGDGYVPGDVNGDGIVDSADITAIIKIMKDGDGTSPGNSYYATKAELEDVIALLQASIVEVRVSNTAYTDAQIDNAYHRFQDQVNMILADYAKKEDIETLRASIDVNTMDLQTAMVSIARLNDRFVVLQDNLSMLSHDVQSAYYIATDALNSTNANKADIDALKVLVNELRAYLDKLASDVTKINVVTDKLRTDNAALSERMDNIESYVADLSDDNAALRVKVMRLEDQSAMLKQTVNELIERVRALESDN
jgi:chromosome segregation ATPase